MRSAAGRLPLDILKSRMRSAPLVSIVTPCLNAAAYIGETIESVLRQDYPHIEYRVVDGGSTDETLKIAAAFGDRVSVVSEPDTGVSAAINRGFRLARGSIITWLNADDTYLPGAVSRAVSALTTHPAAVAVYGNAYWTEDSGQILRPYPVHPDASHLLEKECFICQPACFMRATAVQAAGLVDETLQCSFDYELWMRLSRHGPMVHVPEYWATSRMHQSNKTLGQRLKVFDESILVLLKHFGYVKGIHNSSVYLHNYLQTVFNWFK